MERMQAGMIIYSTRKKHVRAWVFIEAVARSYFKSLNFFRLFGHEIKFQAIEEIG